MQIRNFVTVLVAVLSLASCNSNGQGVKNLNTDEFEKGVQTKGVQIVDVRTPGEYAEKHIAGATNIDVSSADFEKEMSQLDKTKPTYVYCLSGGRSGQASGWAAKNGFTEVYNLNGGMLAWGNANKPVETGAAGKKQQGMSFDDYLAKVKSPDKLILVDFNAVWCGPCKMLKPIVHKVQKDNDKVLELFEVDVDKNPDVAKTMNINAIPLLVMYKDGKEVWRNMGLTDEATINEYVKKFGAGLGAH